MSKRKQEIEMRMSEIREAVNAPEEPENMAELRAEYVKLEQEWRLVQDNETDDAEDEFIGNLSPERAEIRRLAEQVELRRYMQVAVTEVRLDGAEAELNAALELRGAAGTMVPWEALAPIEVRVDAVTNAPSDIPRSTAPIIDRVFAGGGASFLGVAMPSVPSGERLYTHMSAGATAEPKSKAASVDAAAATFTPTTFKPIRLTARYLWNVEDAAELSGMESALRGDLREALKEKMDDQILNGNGTAPNVAGFFATKANGGLGDVANPGTVVTAESMIQSYASQVDGRYAKMQSDTRFLIGATTFAKLSALVQGNAYVFDRYQDRTRVSALVPAAAANVQQAIAAKVGAPGMYAIAPVWQGVELIRDQVTKAESGQIALTAIALWNFGIIRAEGFNRLKFKLA